MSRKLQKLRRQIDQIDKKLLKTLAIRFKITKKIREYKRRYSLPVSDKKREIEIFRDRDSWAEKLKLNQNLVKEIFRIIFKTVREDYKKKQN